MGLLMCECRILYQNKVLCENIINKMGEDIKKNHNTLKKRLQNPKVKESADDVLMMLFDD